MAAGLVVPVSGPYTGTYFGLALGTQNDDGFVLAGNWAGQEINASDAYGMTLVEAIYRGLNWKMRFRGLEFNKPGILYAINSFGATGALNSTLTPKLANIGDRWTNYMGALVLTAILGNPPTFVQTLTALSAGIAPNSNAEYLMTSKVRQAPFEMVLLPYQSNIGSLSNINASFTTT